jgi:hypothetical protein
VSRDERGVEIYPFPLSLDPSPNAFGGRGEEGYHPVLRYDSDFNHHHHNISNRKIQQ